MLSRWGYGRSWLIESGGSQAAGQVTNNHAKPVILQQFQGKVNPESSFIFFPSM